MARETKKQQTKHPPAEEKSLEHLMLDQLHGKYQLVALAAAWAVELRRREEFRHLTQNEILELALKEILTGAVTPEVVRARATENAKAAAAALDGKEKK